MKIEVSENGHKELSCELVFNNNLEYIRELIKIYAVLAVKHEKWLARRELDFMVVTVLNYLDGITNPNSPKAKERYKKYFNPKQKSSEISVYVGKLTEKNWISYDKTKNPSELDIHAFFKQLVLGEDYYKFNLNLRLNASQEY